MTRSEYMTILEAIGVRLDDLVHWRREEVEEEYQEEYREQYVALAEAEQAFMKLFIQFQEQESDS